MTAGWDFIFRHQFAALLATLLLMVATGYLYVKMPKGFFRSRIPGSSLANLMSAKTLRCSKTDKIRRKVVDIVMQDPGVQGVI